MKQPEKGAYRIVRFNEIRGVDPIQAEHIIEATRPVAEIRLAQDEQISYVDARGELSTITNKSQDQARVFIFANNIMFDEKHVQIKTGGDVHVLPSIVDDL